MILKKIFAGLGLVVCFSLLAVSLVEARDWPAPRGQVNDYAQIFSPSYRQELEAKLRSFEAETSAEIAVVTIKSLAGEPIEQVATELFEQWQIGKAQKDNGILLLIAFDDRQVRIEVGYGLEPVITDGRAGRIIREKIGPAFKRDKYEEGVELAIQELARYLQLGEPVTETVKEQAAPLFPILIFGFISLVSLGSFLGRSKRSWPGGVLGLTLGLILGLISGVTLWLVLWPILLAFLGLILDWIFSRHYQKLKSQGKSTDFWSSGGGGFFSGGGSSGGFGGFGGGSSGGGGASGRW